jgi:lysophospholipase L1-like esterase
MTTRARLRIDGVALAAVFLTLASGVTPLLAFHVGGRRCRPEALGSSRLAAQNTHRLCEGKRKLWYRSSAGHGDPAGGGQPGMVYVCAMWSSQVARTFGVLVAGSWLLVGCSQSSTTRDAAAGGAGSVDGGLPPDAAGGSAGAASVAYSPCPTDGSPCRIMPFGDSITDGFGVPGGYRVELFRGAHQAGKNVTFVGTGSNGPAEVDGVAFPPNHEGHSGYTIDTTPSRAGIAPLVATVMPQFRPQVVTLMIGTNDAIDDYDLANAPARLGALIDSIFGQLPDALLVVAQPIPSRDDALNLRLQTYNAAIVPVVQARADAGDHILLIDMYPVIANDPNYKSTLLQDTWHPNVAGHALIGAAWYGALGNSLR